MADRSKKGALSCAGPPPNGCNAQTPAIETATAGRTAMGRFQPFAASGDRLFSSVCVTVT